MTAARRSFRWNRQDIVPFQESGSRLDIVRLLARSVMLIERGQCRVRRRTTPGSGASHGWQVTARLTPLRRWVPQPVGCASGRPAAGENESTGAWHESRARAPHHSPSRTADDLREQILGASARLVANPRAQYGALAIQWELRRLGVIEIPPARRIERILARAGVAQPRRRQAGYVSKHVPYPRPVDIEPGATH